MRFVRFVAGAACPKEIINFMDAIGIPICEGYGELHMACFIYCIDSQCPRSLFSNIHQYAWLFCTYRIRSTETSPVIALNVLSKSKAESIGQVLSGVDVWILDSNGKALEAGNEGESCCRYVLFGFRSAEICFKCIRLNPIFCSIANVSSISHCVRPSFQWSKYYERWVPHFICVQFVSFLCQ